MCNGSSRAERIGHLGNQRHNLIEVAWGGQVAGTGEGLALPASGEPNADEPHPPVGRLSE